LRVCVGMSVSLSLMSAEKSAPSTDDTGHGNAVGIRP